MNTKWVATSNARTFIKIYQYKINWGLIFFISALLFVSSCSKSDDLETIINGSPIINHYPIPNPPPPIDTGTQITYIDVEPDFESLSIDKVYKLDLNDDGIIDFSLGTHIDPYIGILWAEPNKNTDGVNGLGSISGPFESFIQPLNKDFVITEELDSPYFYDTYGGYIGWLGVMDKYLALRFSINEKIHYGWVRLDVTNNSRWIVKDYAYNAAPGKPIYAGQKE